MRSVVHVVRIRMIEQCHGAQKKSDAPIERRARVDLTSNFPRRHVLLRVSDVKTCPNYSQNFFAGDGSAAVKILVAYLNIEKSGAMPGPTALTDARVSKKCKLGGDCRIHEQVLINLSSSPVPAQTLLLPHVCTAFCIGRTAARFQLITCSPEEFSYSSLT